MNKFLEFFIECLLVLALVSAVIRLLNQISPLLLIVLGVVALLLLARKIKHWQDWW